MSKQLYLYPTLTDQHVVDAGISYSKLEFYYNDKRLTKLTGEVKQREIVYDDQDQTTIELNDKSGVWDVGIDDLLIQQSVKIKSPSYLFGENGIAVENSKIGVAVLWSSKKSRQRGSKKIGTLSQTDGSSKFQIELSFDTATLTGILEYSVVLFVEEPNLSVDQFTFANESGLNLGAVFESTIILEGDESSFPIVSIESEEKPLWSLYYSWGTLDESFNESVTLRLNKSHSDYRFLNMEDTKYYNEPLFKQILIQVVAMILEKARSNNDIEIAIDNDNFENGTVGSLIKYYIETYDVNYESYETILESVMKGVWNNG